MPCSQTPYFPSGTYRPDCYSGDDSTTTFAVTFPYINQDSHDGSNSPYLKLFLYNTTLGTSEELSSSAFTMPTSTSVTLSQAPYSYQELWIVRDSSVNGRLVDYAGGSTVSDSSLDLDGLQAWYLWEESVANGELLQTQASDKNYFGTEFEFTGDGATTDFTLDDGEVAITTELSKISLWIFVNGVFAQSDDYTTDLDTSGIVYVSFDTAPETGDDILVRVAQQESLAINIADDSIDTDKLQDCSVTMEKLCLDGEGTDKQIASWTGGGGEFGANTPDHTWISDFDTGVQSNPIDQMAAPTGDLDLNSQKITSLQDGTAATDAATVGQIPSLTGGTVKHHNLMTNAIQSETREFSDYDNGSWLVFVYTKFWGGPPYGLDITVNGTQITESASTEGSAGNGFSTFPVVVTISAGKLSITVDAGSVKMISAMKVG